MAEKQESTLAEHEELNRRASEMTPAMREYAKKPWQRFCDRVADELGDMLAEKNCEISRLNREIADLQAENKTLRIAASCGCCQNKGVRPMENEQQKAVRALRERQIAWALALTYHLDAEGRDYYTISDAAIAALVGDYFMALERPQDVHHTRENCGCPVAEAGRCERCGSKGVADEADLNVGLILRDAKKQGA